MAVKKVKQWKYKPPVHKPEDHVYVTLNARVAEIEKEREEREAFESAPHRQALKKFCEWAKLTVGVLAAMALLISVVVSWLPDWPIVLATLFNVALFVGLLLMITGDGSDT